MKKEIQGGASLGKRTNTKRREEAKLLQEIRIYNPSQEVVDYINYESDKKMESKSLIGNTLLNEAITNRKTKKK